MLVIRDAQMNAFEADRRRQFIARLMSRCRSEFSASTTKLSDPELNDRIEGAWKRGQSLGLKVERDLGAFIELDILLGERFEHLPQYPWMLRLLSDASMEPGERLKLTYLRLAAVEAAAAARA